MRCELFGNVLHHPLLGQFQDESFPFPSQSKNLENIWKNIWKNFQPTLHNNLEITTLEFLLFLIFFGHNMTFPFWIIFSFFSCNLYSPGIVVSSWPSFVRVYRNYVENCRSTNWSQSTQKQLNEFEPEYHLAPAAELLICLTRLYVMKYWDHDLATYDTCELYAATRHE